MIKEQQKDKHEDVKKRHQNQNVEEESKKMQILSFLKNVSELI